MARSVKAGMTALALLAAPTFAQAPRAAANDYSGDAAWLCRPNRNDACAVDQASTVVAADGRLTPAPFTPAKSPAIDCFYVYPTVSTDPTPNSDMTADEPERRVVEQQLARFSGQCRLFAPLYRQVTLTALRAAMTGQAANPDRDLAYRDVRAAWHDYLARDNQGRGVVLIGHSQGAGHLKRLIAEEIEGKPTQARVVSALIIGHNLLVPAGKDVGGDLKHMPLCRSTTQTGCVVSYVTFRDTVPPPANSRFARAPEGMRVACVNPAAPAGGRKALKAYLSNRALITAAARAPVAWAKGAKVNTPFVQVPGLLTGECIERDGASYLAVTVNADPTDVRTDEIAGDVVAGDRVLADWGLHLIDMNVAMGNLVDLVGTQAKSFRSR